MQEEKKAFIKHVVEEIIPLHKFLGIELLDVDEEKATLKVPYRPELLGNPMLPALHGGIISTMMDAVGGIAGMTTLKSPEDHISTIDIRIDYLRPGKAENLIAEGKIARSGNRIVVAQMLAYNEGKRDTPIAEGKGVYNVKRKTDKTD